MNNIKDTPAPKTRKSTLQRKEEFCSPSHSPITIALAHE